MSDHLLQSNCTKNFDEFHALPADSNKGFVFLLAQLSNENSIKGIPIENGIGFEDKF